MLNKIKQRLGTSLVLTFCMAGGILAAVPRAAHPNHHAARALTLAKRFASGDPTYPGTVYQDPNESGSYWINPDNVKASDNAYAYVYSTGYKTLQTSNYGFGLGTGDVVDAVLIEIEGERVVFASAAVATLHDVQYHLLNAGGTAGYETDAGRFLPSPNAFGTDEGCYAGSDEDLSVWGLSSIPVSNVNSSSFGFSVKLTFGDPDNPEFMIDSIRIRLYYHTPTGERLCAVRSPGKAVLKR